MTDKVQLIKQESERRIENLSYLIPKEIVIDSVKRIVKVEDAENWLRHNQTAYQL